MDSRSIELSNRSFSADFCCCCDSNLTLDCDISNILRLLDFPSTHTDFDPKCGLLTFVAESERRQLKAEFDIQVTHGEDIELFVPLLSFDKEIQWFVIRGKRIAVDEDGNMVCGVLIAADGLKKKLDENKAEIERYRQKLSVTEDMVSVLQVKAEQDPLTLLLNASATRSLSEAYLADTDKNCALLIIDVDDFKQVNDCYGHLTGDKALTQAANVIKRLFRSNDIIGRIGGDEFLVLMKDVTEPEIVYKRCEQIVTAFHNIECDQLPQGIMGCSVGAVLSAAHTYTYNRLFCRADKALYTAKALGGDRFHVGDPESDE